MTFNDPSWSVFWACGTGGRQTRPDAAGVRTGKHVGGDNVVSRAAELIGYIVMESGVRGTFGGIANEAGQGPVIARGYVQGDYVYDFSTSFSQPPEVLIVSQAQMGGSGVYSAMLESFLSNFTCAKRRELGCSNIRSDCHFVWCCG